jgi:hypothetical protein
VASVAALTVPPNMPVVKHFWVSAWGKFEADFLQAELLCETRKPIYDLNYWSNWK